MGQFQQVPFRDEPAVSRDFDGSGYHRKSGTSNSNCAMFEETEVGIILWEQTFANPSEETTTQDTFRTGLDSYTQSITLIEQANYAAWFRTGICVIHTQTV